MSKTAHSPLVFKIQIKSKYNCQGPSLPDHVYQSIFILINPGHSLAIKYSTSNSSCTLNITYFPETSLHLLVKTVWQSRAWCKRCIPDPDFKYMNIQVYIICQSVINSNITRISSHNITLWLWHGQNVKQVLTMHTKSNKLFTTMMKENDGTSNCTIKVQDTVNSGMNIGWARRTMHCQQWKGEYLTLYMLPSYSVCTYAFI